FLDRDGVLNEGGKLNSVSELKLLPQAAASMRRLKAAERKRILVTNQGGLGEDLNGNRFWKGAPMTRAQLQTIHAEMCRRLGPVAPDLIKFCPPSKSIECLCRKPLPGMLREAAGELGIDLGRSYMIGDMVTDVEAGLAAGCTPILVCTGFDKTQKDKCPPTTIIVPTIKEAVDFVLADLEKRAH